MEANLEVDILVNSALWKGQEDLLSNALAAAAQKMGKSGSVSLLLGDDASIAELNQQFRNKAGPTNVLSFPPAPGAEPGFARSTARGAPPLALPAPAARRAESGFRRPPRDRRLPRE